MTNDIFLQKNRNKNKLVAIFFLIFHGKDIFLLYLKKLQRLKYHWLIFYSETKNIILQFQKRKSHIYPQSNF